MGFVGILLKIVGYLPSIIVGIENLFGKGNGGQKQSAAVDLAGTALGLSNAIAAKDIVDPGMFQDGLKDTIAGVVKMLNASIWHKSKQPV